MIVPSTIVKGCVFVCHVCHPSPPLERVKRVQKTLSRCRRKGQEEVRLRERAKGREPVDKPPQQGVRVAHPRRDVRAGWWLRRVTEVTRGDLVLLLLGGRLWMNRPRSPI